MGGRDPSDKRNEGEGDGDEGEGNKGEGNTGEGNEGNEGTPSNTSLEVPRQHLCVPYYSTPQKNMEASSHHHLIYTIHTQRKVNTYLYIHYYICIYYTILHRLLLDYQLKTNGNQ